MLSYTKMSQVVRFPDAGPAAKAAKASKAVATAAAAAKAEASSRGQ